MLLDESLLYNYSLCMIDTFHLIIVCLGPRLIKFVDHGNLFIYFKKKNHVSVFKSISF